MSGAPLPSNESQRLRVLHECEILDTEPEPAFDSLVALAAQLTKAPIALLSFVDRSRQWFKARVGLEMQETPREQSFCAHAILHSEPLIVEDAAADERFADNPLVIGAPGIRFYAGFPLELSDGARLGTLCVIELHPRTLTAQERQVLSDLADQVSAQLELRRTLSELRQRREREQRGPDVTLRARAREAFQIGRALNKRMAEELLTIAGRIEALIPDNSAGQGELREALLSVKDQVAEMAFKARSLATHVRDFSLLTSGWLATARVDIDQLQHEHGVHITLEDGADPDELLSYATAYLLSECVHAALSTVIALCGARQLSLSLLKQGSMLVVCVRHDGPEGKGTVSDLLPAARLRALTYELGAELAASRDGDFNVLRLGLALSSPAAPPLH